MGTDYYGHISLCDAATRNCKYFDAEIPVRSDKAAFDIAHRYANISP